MFSDLVPARRGRFSLRRRLQSSRCPRGNTSSRACSRNFPKRFSCSKDSAARGKPRSSLLTEGGMQWAYSELFQNYSGREVAGYLDYASSKANASACYVHYSETHDNERLAKRGRAWSLLRNRLCALTSVERRLRFHLRRRMARAGTDQCPLQPRPGLGQSGQPRPRTGATEPAARRSSLLFRRRETDALERRRIRRSTRLRRESAEGKDSVLVLVNNDVGTRAKHRRSTAE